MNPKQSIKPLPIDASISERWQQRKKIILAKVSLPKFFRSLRIKNNREVWEYATEIEDRELESYIGRNLHRSSEV